MRIQPATAQLPATATPPARPEVAIVAGQTEVPLSQPFTLAYVNALKAKRSELSRQIESAQGRRDDVAKALQRAPVGPAQTGLEQRLVVLDGRLAQLETDIAANGRQLAAAPGNLLTSSSSEQPSSQDFGPFGSGQLTAISIVFTIAVLMPIALAAARTLFKRASVLKPSPQLLESSARLERMEQAIDAVAVEVERISEGQRFVTQLLGKRAELPLKDVEVASERLSAGHEQERATGY